jgi:hypothetical protein
MDQRHQGKAKLAVSNCRFIRLILPYRVLPVKVAHGLLDGGGGNRDFAARRNAAEK